MQQESLSDKYQEVIMRQWFLLHFYGFLWDTLIFKKIFFNYVFIHKINIFVVLNMRLLLGDLTKVTWFPSNNPPNTTWIGADDVILEILVMLLWRCFISLKLHVLYTSIKFSNGSILH